MSGNTSVTLGKHFDRFVSRQIKSGHFGTASEAIRSGLRLLEEREARLKGMRNLLIEGEESGVARNFSFASLKKKLNKRRRPQ